jgi:hypothetical protein
MSEHKIEPHIDFDWDLVEPDQRPDVEAELRKATASALCKFAHQLLQVGGRNQRQFYIAANCMAFAAHIHPAQDQTGQTIAKNIELSKANFFRRVNQWRDVLKLPRIAGAWKESSRQSIKQATTKTHEKRKQQRSSGIVGLIAQANSGKRD